MTDIPTTTESTDDHHTDLDALRARDDVDRVRDERPFPDEKFEALRERYDDIAGVVQVGLVDAGEVLLVRGDEWAPPGGHVPPGQDWEATAREAMADLTGVPVDIDRPVRLEETAFCRAGDEADRFLAPSAFFAASLVGDDEATAAFRAAPTFDDALDDPLYGDGSEFDLGWHDGVPADAHPNHVEHVELFVE